MFGSHLFFLFCELFIHLFSSPMGFVSYVSQICRDLAVDEGSMLESGAGVRGAEQRLTREQGAGSGGTRDPGGPCTLLPSHGPTAL